MTLEVRRRHVLAIGLACLFGLPATATAFPERPVTLVVNSAPGGGADILARALADGLGAALGGRVIVENRPGAGGNLAAGHVARVRADGYTLYVADSGTLAINPTLYASLPFDPMRDFEPIARLASFPVVIAAHPSTGFRSLQDLIAAAKAAPRTINYASTGIGSPQHLAAELLQSATGIELVHVPYRGGAPAAVDLLAGHVRVGFIGIPPLAPAIRDGRLVGLGITGKSRSPLLPDVPAVAETIPGFEALVWFGLFTPRGTPAAIHAQLAAATTQAMGAPAMTEMLDRLGYAAFPGAAEDLRSFLGTEIARWGEAVRRSGARVE